MRNRNRSKSVEKGPFPFAGKAKSRSGNLILSVAEREAIRGLGYAEREIQTAFAVFQGRRAEILNELVIKHSLPANAQLNVTDLDKGVVSWTSGPQEAGEIPVPPASVPGKGQGPPGTPPRRPPEGDQGANLIADGAGSQADASARQQDPVPPAVSYPENISHEEELKQLLDDQISEVSK